MLAIQYRKKWVSFYSVISCVLSVPKTHLWLVIRKRFLLLLIHCSHLGCMDPFSWWTPPPPCNWYFGFQLCQFLYLMCVCLCMCVFKWRGHWPYVPALNPGDLGVDFVWPLPAQTSSAWESLTGVKLPLYSPGGSPGHAGCQATSWPMLTLWLFCSTPSTFSGSYTGLFFF